jgi:hypothetical protein
LPRGLTFGPANGPEDFQELVFIIFSRRLNMEWYLFLDDLTVATCRPVCLPPGPSGADDVIDMSVRAQERGGGSGLEEKVCAISEERAETVSDVGPSDAARTLALETSASALSSLHPNLASEQSGKAGGRPRDDRSRSGSRRRRSRAPGGDDLKTADRKTAHRPETGITTSARCVVVRLVT